MNMRPGTPWRGYLFVAGAFALLCICGFVYLRLVFSRTKEFLAQAQAGQPIVQCIEQYRMKTGHYPPSLADLAPKHSSAQELFTGWEYQTVTNGAVVSYTFRYYMGRGGVEYEPPNWIGNDEGHRSILLRNRPPGN
jgi:hypothetical protein